ncbi:tetratricopeptide repeat protein [Streptomyces sp. HPF1205]|uniref:protein kinase domain-containing protein n=1 Tax=Streptomyces sp. HPF1205 TaxID=2873262 RepID=UPI001CED2F9F|nr:tetratricopeptide repeat protein [Streptomyces sp. HPF1205]
MSGPGNGPGLGGTRRTGRGTGSGTGSPTGRHDVSIGVANVRPDPWYGLDLADTPGPPEPPGPAGPPGAETPAQQSGPVAEEHRFCGNPACGAPVGRGHDGVPGRTSGFCPTCGTPFDFTQLLGLVIAERYEVERYLGAGAYGAAYLAHDRNLATDVVLKKLGNTSVARTALYERNVLVGLRHDSIVRILGYEAEGPHLVLEYIPGVPLAARPGDRLEHLLAHGLRILQALDYLHSRGLLHCDVKPVNIIRFKEENSAGARDRVRLIDFGSVRSLTKDKGPVTAYTPLYAPPPEDREHLDPTPGFDLFCLGTTLEEVCRSHLRERTAPGIDSLHLLIKRATDTAVPSRRFSSARQFGEQLSGVIRQVVAAPPTLRQVTRLSALFGSMAEPLHGGLGAARPLSHWLEATQTEDEALVLPPAFVPPAPGTIAVALPTPLGDPDEPDLGDAAESALAESRLALRRMDPELAERALSHARLPTWHWLRSWYAGLIALAGMETGGEAEGEADPGAGVSGAGGADPGVSGAGGADPGEKARAAVATATARFTEVRRALPGELIPQLALGLCAELAGDLEVAQAHYATVFGTTPALGAAGFGLARVHLLAGRRAEAVATAERLAQEFRYEREARVAAVRLLVTVAAGSPAPSPDDLARAEQLLAGLAVDPASAAGLRAELQYARYLPGHLLGRERLALSETVRRLGPHVRTEHDYVALIDLANRLRPPLKRRWGARRGGSGRPPVAGSRTSPSPAGQSGTGRSSTGRSHTDQSTTGQSVPGNPVPVEHLGR